MRGISVQNGTEFPSLRGKGAIFSSAQSCKAVFDLEKKAIH